MLIKKMQEILRMGSDDTFRQINLPTIQKLQFRSIQQYHLIQSWQVATRMQLNYLHILKRLIKMEPLKITATVIKK